MHVTLVLTVIGRDRPGLVENLARIVADHDGNWLESRMSRLGGEFAGILRLTVNGDREEELRSHLADLAPTGLAVLVRRDEVVAEAPTRLVLLELTGHDRPGIVRQVATTLAAHGANVEELDTTCGSAPMSGEPLFQARVQVALPAACDLEHLRSDLEQVAAGLLVELSLEPVARESA